ncbi:MAG TPA: multiheme c-type cytochrome, partial [Pirellulaceae bacterium]|nr:multiheme c-type cytochrome [Pirellulaceae bacterium]
MGVRGRKRFLAFVAMAICLAGGVAVWLGIRGGRPNDQPLPDEMLAAFRPAERPDGGYVSSAECQSCHPRNHASWHASFHRTMTQVASPESVRGDFTAGPFQFDGRYYALQRRGDQFWAVMDDPDRPFDPRRPEATRIERPIVLVSGSHHLQLYWYATGQSRVLGLLPVHYLIDEKKWLPTSATMLRPGGEPFESDTGRWNTRCIQCHTTHGRTRPGAQGEMDTMASEFGISCEACHGPGEEHVKLRRAAAKATERLSDQLADRSSDRSTDRSAGADTVAASSAPVESAAQASTRLATTASSHDSIENPAQMSSKRASQVCGLCHSYTLALNDRTEQQELQNGFIYRPGQELTESLVLLKHDHATRRHLTRIGLDPDGHFSQRFWPDGMVRVAGREYNSLIESACHQRGDLSCLSCHAMHKPESDPRSLAEWAGSSQLKPLMETDQACVQCHAAERYSAESHTHHKLESHGSRCYNCHMPHTTYGLLRAMRSHQVESPKALTALRSGRPTGCNLCHLDKSLAWTGKFLEQWYGASHVDIEGDYATNSAIVVEALRGDAAVRVISAAALGRDVAISVSGPDFSGPVLAELLVDPYSAVRFVAGRSLHALPDYAAIEYDFLAPPDERARARVRVLEISA